jgi:hypothetical protein
MADKSDAIDDEKLSSLLAPLREEVTQAEPVPPSLVQRAELLDAAVAARTDDTKAAVRKDGDQAVETSTGGPAVPSLAFAASR